MWPLLHGRDFHSFRRAFNTTLAGANVNVQRAMRLAGHTDGKTHMRYVMKSPEMMAIPEAALPRLKSLAGRGWLANSCTKRAGPAPR